MAYRFNGSTDKIEFAIAPFSGYTFGADTFAALLKRGATGVSGAIVAFCDSGNGARHIFSFSGDNLEQGSGGGADFSSQTPNSTSPWYLVAATWAGSGVTRFHVHDGSSWSHANRGSTSGAIIGRTVVGTDRIQFANRAGSLNADVVCAGVKKADSNDAAIETLNPLYFQTWRNFGFDWLIGFDSSLVSGGLLQDQASPGTGDELSRTGTSAVSDPAGWAWTGLPAATFVPQTIVIT